MRTQTNEEAFLQAYCLVVGGLVRSPEIEIENSTLLRWIRLATMACDKSTDAADRNEEVSTRNLLFCFNLNILSIETYVCLLP